MSLLSIELVIENKKGNIDYVQLKELAPHRSNWRQWKWKPAHIQQNTAKMESSTQAYTVGQCCSSRSIFSYTLLCEFQLL